MTNQSSEVVGKKQALQKFLETGLGLSRARKIFRWLKSIKLGFQRIEVKIILTAKSNLITKYKDMTHMSPNCHYICSFKINVTATATDMFPYL